MSTLLDSIETANSDVAARLSVLQNERDARLIMLKNNQTGPIAKAGQIRDYIASIDPKRKKVIGLYENPEDGSADARYKVK